MTQLDISFTTEDTGDISMAFVTEALEKVGFKNARCYSIAVDLEEEESWHRNTNRQINR
ncbi:hypothetical protein [Bifidobacterium mongoliense]|uniref:hypothetical protein n=1 Tax=Bifidobacterium mongoliense TaxID=518643 RepID=UPI001377C45E|nr:hypothetical protein [Bifidobacterium mongoliense]